MNRGRRRWIWLLACVLLFAGPVRGETPDVRSALENGYALMDQGEMGQALVEFDRAVGLSRETGDTDSLVDALTWAGLAATGIGEYDRGVEYYLEVAEIERETGDRDGEARALAFIGKAYAFLGDFDTGKQYLNEALDISVETGNDTDRCYFLTDLGLLAGMVDDDALAEKYYLEALDLARVLKDESLIYFSLSGLAFMEMDRGDCIRAIEYFTKAADAAERAGHPEWARSARETIVSAEKQAGLYDDAVDHLTEMKDGEGDGGDVGDDLDLEMNIADTLREAGRYDEALSRYETIREAYREREDISGEIAAIRGAAWALEKMNRYEEELTLLEDARELVRSSGDLIIEGQVLVQLGMTLAVLGKKEEALTVLDDARTVNRTAGERMMEAQSLVGLATVNLDDPDRALEYADEALEIYRELGDQVGEGLILGVIATVYYNQGRSLKAAFYYRKVLKLAEEVGDEFPMALDPLITGMLLVGAGEYKEAVKYLEEALSDGMEQDNIITTGYAAAYLGFSYKNMKKYERGVEYYAIAIDALESVRGSIQTEELRTSYMSGKMQVYEDIILMLIELGRDDEAFEYMERSRSRSFLDLLASRDITVADSAGSEYLRQERELRRRLDETVSTPTLEDGDRSAVETRDVETSADRSLDVQHEYRRLIELIKAEDPVLASLVAVVPPSLEAIRTNLGDDVCLIEYFIADEGEMVTAESALFIFVITSRGIDVLTIDTDRAFLEDTVSRLRDAVRSLDDETFLSLSKQLYTMIMAPALEGVDAKTLVIIPHGPLHYLPFTALTDGEAFLIDRYDLVVNPSAGVLEYIDKTHTDDSGEKIIAFGNPETIHCSLPFAETEVARIAAIMGSDADVEVYLGSDATEERGKELFREFDLVHLACHAAFDEADPLDSALYLAEGGGEDGRLTVGELFALELDDTRLVVLSACETGLSRVTGGDELIGLTRGFLYAGTSSIVVTLWEVADDSTADIMIRFYQNMKAGKTPSESLNDAQRWAKSNPDYARPFFWAPFVLVGNWE